MRTNRKCRDISEKKEHIFIINLYTFAGYLYVKLTQIGATLEEGVSIEKCLYTLSCVWVILWVMFLIDD